jgi:hypothetical protein
MRELVRGKNTIAPEVIDPGGCSVEKAREVTLTLNLCRVNTRDIHSRFTCNVVRMVKVYYPVNVV